MRESDARFARPASEALGLPLHLGLSTMFDPGYPPATIVSHIEQSAGLLDGLKLSMGGWLLSDEQAITQKLEAARAHGIPTCAGGTPFEVAERERRLHEYLVCCNDLGFRRVECASESTWSARDAAETVAVVGEHGLELQVELGGKHAGPFSREEVDRLCVRGLAWREAGATVLVIEARESAADVGLFDSQGGLDRDLARVLYKTLGPDTVFEAPTKRSQFQVLDALGPDVRLSNVRPEEIQRVESYRHGLHSDAGAYVSAPRATASNLST